MRNIVLLAILFSVSSFANDKKRTPSNFQGEAGNSSVHCTAGSNVSETIQLLNRDLISNKGIKTEYWGSNDDAAGLAVLNNDAKMSRVKTVFFSSGTFSASAPFIYKGEADKKIYACVTITAQ